LWEAGACISIIVTSRKKTFYSLLEPGILIFWFLFLIKLTGEKSIPKILQDKGFITEISTEDGYLRLVHPELFFEFIVAEKGKGTSAPFDLHQLGVNATALRYVDLLSDNPIKVMVDDFYLTLPHPANFALQKLLISGRRTDRDKGKKDKDMALEVLRAIIANGDVKPIEKTFGSLPEKWKKSIKREIDQEKDIAGILQKS
jgi:hypothetical protein